MRIPRARVRPGPGGPPCSGFGRPRRTRRLSVVSLQREPDEGYGVLDDDEFFAVADAEALEEPGVRAARGGSPLRAAPARAIKVAVVVLVAGVGGAALGLVAVGTIRGAGPAGPRAGAVSGALVPPGSTPTVIAARAVAGTRHASHRPPRMASGGRGVPEHDGAPRRLPRPSSSTPERLGVVSAPEQRVSGTAEPAGVGEFGFER